MTTLGMFVVREGGKFDENEFAGKTLVGSDTTNVSESIKNLDFDGVRVLKVEERSQIGTYSPWSLH